MYQRILVPVDGSATSMRGLHEAIGIAAAQHGRLRILNVLDESILVAAAYADPAGDLGEVVESLRSSGRKALNKAAAQAAKKGIEAECKQVEGRLRPVSDVILDEARNWRADLLVMGTHGRRGVKRLVLGSDAERVLREAPVPVLLVRATESPSRSRKASARRTRTGARA